MSGGFRARVNVQRRADGPQAPRLEHDFHGALLAAFQRETQLGHERSVTVDDLEVVVFAILEAQLHQVAAAARIDDGELALDAASFTSAEVYRIPARFDDGSAAHRCQINLIPFLRRFLIANFLTYLKQR